MAPRSPIAIADENRAWVQCALTEIDCSEGALRRKCGLHQAHGVGAEAHAARPSWSAGKRPCLG
jgi:hypothetical protein